MRLERPREREGLRFFFLNLRKEHKFSATRKIFCETYTLFKTSIFFKRCVCEHAVWLTRM